MPLPVHSTVREDIDSLQQPTLDPPTPEAWQELRALGHRMLDDIFDDLATLREQPAWRPMPEASASALSSPLPIQGRPAEEVYRTLMQHLVPYTIGNRHPRAWGWVRGTGTPLAMLADMLASGLNAHVAGGRQASCGDRGDVPALACGTDGHAIAELGLTDHGRDHGQSHWPCSSTEREGRL